MRRLRPWDDAGTSAVELAILAPVIVALLGMVIFLADFGVARIRQRAVARFVAWEFTAHALSDEADLRHAASWQAADVAAHAAARRQFEGGVSTGLLASSRSGTITTRPVSMRGEARLQRPAMPSGFGAVLRPLGDLLQKASGLQLPLLERWGLNVRHVGVLVEAELQVEGTGLLPDLPAKLVPTPARLELQVDTWALDDGADVPLPGLGTTFGRQVGRIALLGFGEKLRSSRAGAALDWIPITLAAPVVSMNYGPPARDQSPVTCGGDDALARTGRWENGKAAGTKRDTMSPVRCFDTLPIDANGFGVGKGRRSDPTWQQLVARGPFQHGCNQPQAAFPGGCGTGGGGWADASSR